VKSYSGLLSDFAYENQIFNIVRGARNAADFDFEKLLSDINHGLNMGLETFIMIADKNLSHISSSAVKELQEHQAKNVKDYVPLVIKEALELKISEQYRIGITGGIGNGKSFVENTLMNIYKDRVGARGFNIKHKMYTVESIDMDKIGRYILSDSEESIHKRVRHEVAEKLGKKLLINEKIVIPALLHCLFEDINTYSLRPVFEKIMAEPTLHQIRKKLIGIKGIVLISSALFVEQNVCDLVNNNFIYINCSEDVRMQRLKKRGYSLSEIKNRLDAQLSSETKLDAIKELVRERSCGSIIEFDNSQEEDSRDRIGDLLSIIIRSFEQKI
jgi:pantetheine-phosphate adenylyltransferase